MNSWQNPVPEIIHRFVFLGNLIDAFEDDLFLIVYKHVFVF